MTNSRTSWTVLGLVAAALIIVFIPARAKAQADKTSQSAGQQAAPAIPAGPAYVIGPGDVLDIDVWQNSELSFKGLPVRPDGKISIPLLNDVQAAGLTAMQLSSDLSRKLKKYVKGDPVVTVVVTQVNSQRFYVLGEVAHPGVFPLLPGTTALQAISTAGGFTEFANEKKVYILRESNGRSVKLPFNYKMVVQGKALDENVELKPGDQIIVP
ncbi:MAG: polysaccharide biosynthesis/export family protein [Terriglobia bacterium]